MTGPPGPAPGPGPGAAVAPLSEREYQTLVRTAGAAPSVHDTQPWLCRLRGDRVELWADQRRALPRIDPNGQRLVISCGAALLNLRLAMARMGFADRTTLYPDRSNPALLATVARGPAQTPDPQARRLHAAIFDRRTTQGRHRPEPLDRAVVLRLHRAARQERAVLHEVRTGEQRSVLGAALRRAIAAELGDEVLRAEFLAWVRQAGADGVPGDGAEHAREAHPAAGSDGRLTTADLHTLDAMVRRESFFLLATRTDDPPDWLRCGQALQRVLLTAHDAGLAVSVLNQPIKAAAVHGLLPPTLDLPGVAQMLLRVGYPWTRSPAAAGHPVGEAVEH